MNNDETVGFVDSIRDTFDNLSVIIIFIIKLFKKIFLEIENSDHSLHRRIGTRRRS